MSKKKGKSAARTAPKKAARPAPRKTARKAARTPAAKARSRARLTATAPNGRTLTVTIFLYRTGNGNRIRTSPQRLYANPGDRVEWNVVNLIDGTDVPVTITWPEQGPWGKEPIVIRSFQIEQFGEVSGRFKYVVSALDAQEDPEVELPEGN